MIFHDTTGKAKIFQPINSFLKDIDMPTTGVHKLHLSFGPDWTVHWNKPSKKQKTWSIYAQIILERPYPYVIRQVVWVKRYFKIVLESKTDEEVANDELDSMIFKVGEGFYLYLRKTKQLKGKPGRISRGNGRVFAFKLMRKFKQWREINGY